MPPRLPLGSKAILGQGISVTGVFATRGTPICLFCSLSLARAGASLTRPRRRFAAPARMTATRRRESTTATSTPPRAEENPRKQLEEALVDLQKHAPTYINISRTQLALQGLRQEPGRESVRLAILGLGNASAGRAARGLLRSILADPLAAEQEWERQLDSYDDTRPLIIRVRPEPSSQSPESESETPQSGFTTSGGGSGYGGADGVLQEILVSSPTLNGNGLEILLTTIGAAFPSARQGDSASFYEAALVPSVDIPTSDTGRFTQVTTPVHKALVVGDGILGAASVAALPLADGAAQDEIGAAVNLKGVATGCPFIAVDVDSARQAVDLFRQDVSNAMKFEELWFQSNMYEARDWLLRGAVSNDEGSTKPAVRTLVASVLRNALAAIWVEEAQSLSSALRTKTAADPIVASLNKALAEWAEGAHSELQAQLDAAFTGRRWRKLGWWKLFWRVDDVGMLSSEMISQRFLPGAERDAIYLAGRIDGATTGLLVGSGAPSSLPTRAGAAGPGYALPKSVSSSTGSPSSQTVASPSAAAKSKWPTHIAHTKRYLLDESVPALQALAQKLVVQTLSTSTLTTSLGVLAYLSSFGLYESGAVAALGAVWSLRRMQRKWETAREFWEGEVREEGRKAVRAVEASVADVLDGAAKGGKDESGDLERLRQAKELVGRAEESLEGLK